MIPLFIVSAGVLFYVYCGYPLLLFLVSSFVRRPSRPAPSEPSVTFLISAYNEEDVLREKLQNTLALDYPAEKLEIIVVSDCSTDGTDAIAREYEPFGVRLVQMQKRGGKTAGLNAAVSRASGDILVFSDANALYRPDSVRQLVRNFADPQVGCVTGESRYLAALAGTVGANEGLYWKYERALKVWESRLGSMVGSDGAIMALRTRLYRKLDPADLNDLVIPLQVVQAGLRCVYEPEAVCDEQAMTEYTQEFRRKQRVVNRSVRAIGQFTDLLNPFRYGAFAIQLWSHKALRWTAGAWMLTLLIANAFLIDRGTAWRAAFLVQLAFYGLAGLGGFMALLRLPGLSLLRLPAYLCMVNAAALYGIGLGLSGRTYVTWKPERDHPKPRLDATDPAGARPSEPH